MSNEGNKPQNAESAQPEKSPLEILQDRYESRGKAIATVGDDQQVFSQFIASFDESNPLKDWASSAAAKLGDNLTFAVVRVEETGDNRLVAIGAKETLFGTGGDEVAKQFAYKAICNKAMNIAQKPDSESDMFATLTGFLKAKFDMSVYKAFAKDVVSFLHEKGLRGITVPSLRMAMSNAAYAKAQFPALGESQWQVIFAIFEKSAEDAGMDTSLLAHWRKTRDNMTATGISVDDFSLDSFNEFVEDEEAVEESAKASA